MICCLFAGLLTAQNSDIFGRLRRALPEQGAGELAATELARKNFTRVDELLAQGKASNAAGQAEMLALRAAVAFLGGRPSVAVEEFNRSAQLAPLQEGDRFTLAMAYVKLGDDRQASAALADLAARHPERALYVYWLGRIDYDRHRYDESAAKLEKAVELDPRAPRGWDSLGLTYDMQGHMDRALTAFEKAVGLNRQQERPSGWPPHNLGYLLLRLGREREAEASLKESLRYDPGLSQSHYYLARVLEREGRETEAVAEYERAVAGDKVSTEACYSLALLYRKMNRPQESTSMFGEYRRRKEASGGQAAATPEK